MGTFWARTSLRRGLHESRILAGYYGFNANISFTFQAVKNLYAHPTYLCLGRFVNFLAIFRYFLKGLVKFMEIGNFEDLPFGVVLKLKIGGCTPNSCPPTWGAILG